MCQDAHHHLQDKEQTGPSGWLERGNHGDKTPLTRQPCPCRRALPPFPSGNAKAFLFSFFSLLLPGILRTKPAVSVGAVAAVHPLAPEPVASAASEPERTRPAEACEGTKAGSCPSSCLRVGWHERRLLQRRIEPPGGDEGSEKATAIPEDAKQDKYFYDYQKQTHHDASVRTTCICFIGFPSPSRGRGRRFFLRR